MPLVVHIGKVVEPFHKPRQRHIAPVPPVLPSRRGGVPAASTFHKAKRPSKVMHDVMHMKNDR